MARHPSRPAARVPRLTIAGALLVGLVTAAPSRAWPEEAATVRQALAAFSRSARSKLPGERIEAVRALGGLVDAGVAKRLLAFARREQDPEVLAATFDALAAQRPHAPLVAAKLAERLAEESAARRARAARGDAGVLIDPRTGDPDLTSPAGLARLHAQRGRSRMLASLMTALEALGWEPDRSPPDVTPLLQDPADEVVIGALSLLARTGAQAALPAVLELWRMYPNEATWETGAVVDLAGTDASAKATWMVRFGHPDKQRARPEVVRAVRAAVERLAGRPIEGPEGLEAHVEATANAGRGRTPRSRR
jgi:hypothetical protein